MHMSSYPKMYTSRYATKRWISAEAWADDGENEKSKDLRFMCYFELETGGMIDRGFFGGKRLSMLSKSIKLHGHNFEIFNMAFKDCFLKP